MDDEGYIKVIDFGFAKHIPFEKVGTTRVVGTSTCRVVLASRPAA